MERKGRFFDDIAGMAGGAFSVLAGLRTEMEAMAKAQAEAVIQRFDLAKREDLDAALELARRAREEAEALGTRVTALEVKLAAQAATVAAATVASTESAAPLTGTGPAGAAGAAAQSGEPPAGESSPATPPA